MAAGAIQAGGATVVITASDQTAAGIRSAQAKLGGLQTKLAGSATSLGAVQDRLTRIGAQAATRFLGIGVALSGLEGGLRSFGNAMVESLVDPSKSFSDTLAESYINTISQVPIVGSIGKIVFAEQFAELERIKKSTEEIVSNQQRMNQRAQLLNATLASTAKQMEDNALRSRAIDVREMIADGGETAEAIESMRQVERERARLQARRAAEQQAMQAQVSEDSIGVGGEVFRQIQQAAAQSLMLRLREIDIEFDERRKRLREESQRRQQEAERLAAEQAAEAQRLAEEQAREAQQRQDDEERANREIADLQANLQQRIAIARLDAEQAALGSSPTDRARAAELDAQRELLEIQDRLRKAEDRLLFDRRLFEDEREEMIAQEREAAEIARQAVAARLAAAQRSAAAGGAQAESITGSAFGTFSALAAARSSVSADRIQADQLKALVAIERNTQAGATF